MTGLRLILDDLAPRPGRRHTLELHAIRHGGSWRCLAWAPTFNGAWHDLDASGLDAAGEGPIHGRLLSDPWVPADRQPIPVAVSVLGDRWQGEVGGRPAAGAVHRAPLATVPVAGLDVQLVGLRPGPAPGDDRLRLWCHADGTPQIVLGESIDRGHRPIPCTGSLTRSAETWSGRLDIAGHGGVACALRVIGDRLAGTWQADGRSGQIIGKPLTSAPTVCGRTYPDNDGAPRPVLVDAAAMPGRHAGLYCFGGGFTSGSAFQFADQAAWLAARGMPVARIDYRVGAGPADPSGPLRDAWAARRWWHDAAAGVGGEPARPVLFGCSAGSWLTLAMACGVHPDGAPPALPQPVLLAISDSFVRLPDDAPVGPLVAPPLAPVPGMPPLRVYVGEFDDWMVNTARWFAASRALGNDIAIITGPGMNLKNAVA
jgi:hypothetical protein